MKFPKIVLSLLSVPSALSALSFEQPPGYVFLTNHESQEESPNLARKFDEYEMNSATFGDMKARLDRLFDELQREPDLRAYIFIYGSKRKAPRYRSVAIRNYLKVRELPSSRLKIVRGGNRNVPMLEFWIVPKGAEAPKATPPYRPTSGRKH